MSDSIPTAVAKGVDELVGAEEAVPVDSRPMYKVDAASKIPVSDRHGVLWKGRIDAAKSARQPYEHAWSEAIRYYNNNQLDHREAQAGTAGNRYIARRRNAKWSETENIVYANVRALMPALYAKNPQAEFTTVNEQLQPLVQQVEHLVNTLAAMRNVPGLNLKMHARQAVLNTELCNISWIEVGYVHRDQSILAAQDELERISKKLEEAKTTAEMREAEGELMAVEEQLDVFTSPGPYIKYRPASDIICDPDATMPDFSDAKWRAICELYPTSYLNAVYGEKDGTTGRYKSIYAPTHVLTGDTAATSNSDFRLFDTNADAKAYGYENQAQLDKAYRTKCYRIWDRTTRRVYLYADNKWDWPIWVENDPYSFPNFFNTFPLVFNTSPLSSYAPSNVTMYLDQQDAVNEIHDEYRRARQDVRENILFNNKFNRDAVVKWLSGTGPNAEGVDVPDGLRMSDMIIEKPNVMLKAMPLFDLSRLMQSVDRVSGVSDVLRNAQFKTNTTNRAIENYNSTTALRLDEKIDAIEDFIGVVLYHVGHLCLQFMPATVVAEVIGESRAQGWSNQSADELRSSFNCHAVGGSTQKPTSEAKKQQALEIAGILEKLGQFAPTVVITTIFKLLEEAFDEVVIPEDAFAKMQEEVQLAMQRGNSTQGAGSSSSDTGIGQAPSGDMQQVAAIIDQLPPEAKLALGKALAAGAPIAEALPALLQELETTGSEQQGVLQ